MPINIEELKRKHGRDAKPQKKNPEKETTKVVKPLIKKEENEQEVKDKLIKEIINKKLKKGEIMANKKKKPVTRISSGLDRLTKTKGNYEAISSGVPKLETVSKQQDTLDSSLEAMVKAVIYKELPKLIKNGNIDPSFIGSNSGINTSIGRDGDLMRMMDILSSQYKSKNENNINNPFEQFKQFLEIIRIIEPEKRGDDMNNVLATVLTQLIKQKDNSGNNFNAFISLFNQMMQMNEKYSNARIETLLARLGSGAPSEDPQDKLMRNWQFFRDIMGDKRQKSKDEMEFDLKRKELDLKEYARRDMLDREERQQAREDAKGARILDTAGVVLDKVIGNGLGNLVGDLMSVKDRRGKIKGKSSNTLEDEYKYLDEL